MTPSGYLLDAGPLVALLNRRETHHEWAVRVLDTLEAPLFTCEAVLSEAWFLTRRGGGDPTKLLDVLQLLQVDVLPVWSARLGDVLRRYANRVSIADASLLVLAEADAHRVVVTTDREDFSIYRLHRRQHVPALMPPP